MQLENYCLMAGVSIIFLIGCLVHLHENDIYSVKVISKFKKLIYILISEIVIDCIFLLLGRQEISHLVLYLLKGLELFMNPVLVFFVFDIFYDKKSKKQDKMRALRIIMIIAIIINAALQLIEVVYQKGFLFFIDNYGLYHRGNFLWIYLLILVTIVSMLIYGIFIFSSRTQIIMKATLIVFVSILIVGILLRGFLPEKNFDFLCMSVAVLFLLMYYSHITLRIDPTTYLLNRHVYARTIEDIDYTTIVIMIDANCFKQINDAYGHECGDRTLKQIARSICEAYGKYAYCFRLGGDEFCAILKPGAFGKLVEESPHYDAYHMANQFMSRLDKAIQDRAKNPNSKDSCLEYGVSQGYGIFYSKDDYPNMKRKMSFNQVIKLADKMMYLKKNKFKKEHPEILLAQEQALSRAKVLYEPSTIKLIDEEPAKDEP